MKMMTVAIAAGLVALAGGVAEARAAAPAPEIALVAEASGYWKTVRTRVWQPGVVERVWVEAVCEHRRGRFGETIVVELRPGYYRTVRHQGRWVWHTQRIWVDTHHGHGHRGHGHGHDDHRGHGHGDHHLDRGRGRGRDDGHRGRR